MKKGELIDSIAGSVDLPKSKVAAVLDELLVVATKQLKKGEAVTLTGFGSFKPVKRAARVGRNPQNGQMLKIPATKSVRFTPGAQLKAAINLSKSSAKKG